MRDEGHAAIELALAVGVLLLPVALVVTAFAPWSEARVDAAALAAEAARTAVLELSLEAGMANLEAATVRQGIDPSEMRFGWCGAAPTHGGSGVCPLIRGGVVTASVEVWTPLVTTPWGSVGGLWVTADHSEPIDLYRSLG